MADDDKPRNADFVGRVVSDPKNPPEARMLSGWLGDAAEEGHRRLYTAADLSAYVDIPADAILHSEPIRDVQPAGGVCVWVKRDAALKAGGSASSRAARFLQGAVQQDFASDPGAFEKAGLRCVTQAPCGEVTGFTGQCTKQPVVGGGAWPCITAQPHCAEPTGFTGQCTLQPWPNPTHYLGCTYLHCPTRDLTHIPQICHIVATGLPGCTVVDPRGGGDPVAKAGVAAAAAGGEGVGGAPADAAAVRPTFIPGCGYTQTWGLCPTHPPKCNVSVEIPCIPPTEMPQHCPTRTGLAAGANFTPATVCTQIGCGGAGAAFFAAAPGRAVTAPSLVPSCGVSVGQICPSAVDACPTRINCDTQPPTVFCTQLGGAQCVTPLTICTQSGPQCPTFCGADCQTQQDACTSVNCTQAGPQCFTQPNGDCTFFGCPSQGDPKGQAGCTQSGPLCPSLGIACTTVAQGCPTNPQLDCTLGCTLSGPTCPATVPANCTINTIPAQARAFHPTTTIGHWPTPATRCFICDPFGAPGAGGARQAGTAVNHVCTRDVRHCPMPPVVFEAGRQIEPTPATMCFICTQVPWLCPVAQ